MRPGTLVRLALAALAALAAATAFTAAAPKAHTHGVVKLNVAVDGGKVTLELEVALHDAVGFERAPRNDKEKAAVAEAAEKLRAGDKLFAFTAEAKCRATRSEVKSSALEPQKGSKEEHAEFQGNYEFTCGEPQAVKTLDVNLFDGLKRVKRVEAVAATPRGQKKATLTPAKRRLAW